MKNKSLTVELATRSEIFYFFNFNLKVTQKQNSKSLTFESVTRKRKNKSLIMDLGTRNKIQYFLT